MNDAKSEDRSSTWHISKGHRPEDRYNVPRHDEFVSKGRGGGKQLPPHRSKGNT